MRRTELRGGLWLARAKGLPPGSGPRRGGRITGAPLKRTADPKAAKAGKAPSPHGTLPAGLRYVLACEMTVAEASRVCGCDRGALERAARKACRAPVMDRDDWTCQNCGRMAQDVQHRIRRGMGGTSDVRIAFGMCNQVGMCRECHSLAEKRDELMHARGFWLESWEDPAAVPVAVFTEAGRVPRWPLADGTWSYEAPKAAA